MSEELESLRRRLANYEENLRLLQERNSEFVEQNTIPLNNIREIRGLNKQIEEIKKQIDLLEKGEQPVTERIEPRVFIDALMACADPSIITELLMEEELAPDNRHRAITSLCLHYGYEYIIRRVLKSGEIEKLCQKLYIDFDDADDEEELIDSILDEMDVHVYRYDKEEVGFDISHRYINSVLEEANEDDTVLAYSTSEVFNQLEILIRNFHMMYLIETVYKFLGETAKRDAKRYLDRGKDFKSRVKHLIKLEREIKNDLYPGCPENLELSFGHRDLFNGADLRLIDEIAKMNFQPRRRQNVNKATCQDLLNRAHQFISDCLAGMPLLIFPVHFSTNLWGVKYIAYLDESDLDTFGNIRSDSDKVVKGAIWVERCNRLYFWETPEDFRRYQPAYLLHPQRGKIVHDPTIYYLSDLQETARKLIEGENE